jgi:hypothetical protein
MRLFLFVCFICTSLSLKAQLICNPNANLILYSNYDGGTLNINVDVNIPNIKIGICSYEAVTINLSGAYVGNVTEVKYAGYNSANNNHCGTPIIATTTINGAPVGATTSITFAPSSPLANTNGNGSIICGYSCSVTTNQGGCNTIDQIEAYFLNQFPGSTLRMHKVQYGCWPAAAHSVSLGGTCCLTSSPNPLSVTTTPTHVTPCFGGCNGSVVAAATGGTPPYAYQWTSGPSSATWSNRCAGVYTVTVTDNTSASATASVTVTQPPQKATTLNQAACDSFLFNSVFGKLSGVYKDTLTASNSCDSIITLNLTVNSADINVTKSGNTLTAAATGATWQWLDCDSNSKAIAGATGKTYTPVKTGNYAVKVTQNGCTDTSVCTNVVIVGIDDLEQPLCNIYPNPVRDEVTIEVGSGIKGSSFTIIDNSGKAVITGTLTEFRNAVSLKHLAPGFYLIRVEGVKEVRKIEKY